MRNGDLISYLKNTTMALGKNVSVVVYQDHVKYTIAGVSDGSSYPDVLIYAGTLDPETDDTLNSSDLAFYLENYHDAANVIISLHNEYGAHWYEAYDLFVDADGPTDYGSDDAICQIAFNILP